MNSKIHARSTFGSLSYSSYLLGVHKKGLANQAFFLPFPLVGISAFHKLHAEI